MKAHGTVHKYGDNVDTDVIIPARYLNTSDHKELAAHCMEDIDKDFVKNVKEGDIMVANMNTRLLPLKQAVSVVSSLQRSRGFSIATRSILVCQFLNVTKPQRILITATR